MRSFLSAQESVPESLMCFSSWSFSCWLAMEANCIPWYLQYWADLYQLACRFPGNKNQKPPVSACADENARNKTWLNKICTIRMCCNLESILSPIHKVCTKDTRSVQNPWWVKFRSKIDRQILQETVVCFCGCCAFGGQTLVGNRLLQQFVLLLGVDGGEMHAVVAAVAISFIPIGLRCQSETK